MLPDPAASVALLDRDDIADRIAELLGELGDTPDAIAYRLAEAGITGRRADARCCPIAFYLRHAEPDFDWVEVYGEVVDVCTTAGHAVSLNASDAVYEFVSLFDIERYPHLITRHADREATR